MSNLKILLLIICIPLNAETFWTNYKIDGLLKVLVKLNKTFSTLSVSVEKYYKMPPLNFFEDYDECMGVHGSGATYCYVQTIITPDKSSDIYQQIETFSSLKKQHFRHDKLTRGICIDSCEKLLDDLNITGNELYVPKFEIDFRVNINSNWNCNAIRTFSSFSVLQDKLWLYRIPKCNRRSWKV